MNTLYYILLSFRHLLTESLTNVNHRMSRHRDPTVWHPPMGLSELFSLWIIMVQRSLATKSCVYRRTSLKTTLRAGTPSWPSRQISASAWRTTVIFCAAPPSERSAADPGPTGQIITNSRFRSEKCWRFWSKKIYPYLIPKYLKILKIKTCGIFVLKRFIHTERLICLECIF